jgi:hypothetical protein
LITKENYQRYRELGNNVRRKTSFVKAKFNSKSLDRIEYVFKSGIKYDMSSKDNDNKDIVV